MTTDTTSPRKDKDAPVAPHHDHLPKLNAAMALIAEINRAKRAIEDLVLDIPERTYHLPGFTASGQPRLIEVHRRRGVDRATGAMVYTKSARTARPRHQRPAK